jgi:hypothetical protein
MDLEIDYTQYETTPSVDEEDSFPKECRMNIETMLAIADGYINVSPKIRKAVIQELNENLYGTSDPYIRRIRQSKSQ